MPEVPELEEVISVLRRESETPRRLVCSNKLHLHSPSDLCSLQDQLRHVLKGVANERSDITGDALKSLYSLLKNNKAMLVYNNALYTPNQ